MKRRNGFTVVEILIAAAVALVVLGALAGLFRAASRSLAPMDAQEQLATVFAAVDDALSDAQAYRIAADGASMEYWASRRHGKLEFDRAAGTLALAEAGARRRVLASGLTGARIFSNTPGLVRVELVVIPPGAGPRNQGVRLPVDVWMPAVGLASAPLVAPGGPVL